MAKIVLFVDALEPAEYTDVFPETERGLVESGVPKVTPKVMGEVYTGQSPSQQGMGRVHSMRGETPHRPMAPTVQEQLEAAGRNVISVHMPYCLPLQLQNGAWVSTSMQQQANGQHPLAQLCMQPPAGGDMLDPETENAAIYNAKAEDLAAKFASLLNAIGTGGFDVAFIAIRSPDEYTHFQWHEPWRAELIKDISYQIERASVNHDVLWFSDHGSQEKRETFRVNEWLQEAGYLDLEIDVDFAERFEAEIEAMNPQDRRAGGGRDIENQLAVQSPGVELLESSRAVCMDPYDSSIDVLDEDLDVDALGAELVATGYYDDYHLPAERWGEGPFLDDCPDLLPERSDHVLVDGNVHPDPIGMGYYRTGVHSAYGAWGTTDESFEAAGDVTPRELHDVIWRFCLGEAELEARTERALDALERQFDRALEGAPAAPVP